MRCVLSLLVVIGLAACAKAPVEERVCRPPAGAQALLTQPGAVLVIGVDASEAAAALDAAREIACAKASPVSTVSLFPQSPAPPTAPADPAAAAAAQAQDSVAFVSVTSPEGPERAAELAALLVETRPLMIIAAPEDAAKRALGPSGETWLPLAARLAQDGPVIALRAQARSAPGAAVTLTPYEDLPAQGPPLVFDGILELGPAEPAS